MKIDVSDRTLREIDGMHKNMGGRVVIKGKEVYITDEDLELLIKWDAEDSE